MNHPTMEQFNELQRKYFELATKVERLDEIEKQRDFTIRDSAVKIGLAEGLAKANHEGLAKLGAKLDANQLEVEAALKDIKQVSSQQFEALNTKLDRQETIVKENSEMLGQHNKRLEAIERTLESHSRTLESHSQTLESHSKRFDSIDAKLDQILARLSEQR